MNLQTEFEFELPVGYVDDEGTLHKHGSMRLATAMDEIAPMSDMRVKTNEAYMVIVLLARVITNLGTLGSINTGVVEKLFAADLAYLQTFYQRINETGKTQFPQKCPHCGKTFELDISNLGGD
jgi:hypothetical protein